MDQTESTEVRVERVVDAPIGRAFKVFTQRIDEWWPRPYHLGPGERTDLRIEPVQGGSWFEVTEDGTCPWGRVMSWDPPHRVVLGWQITPSFSPEPDPAKASSVDVAFEVASEERTTVTVTHRDFQRHGDDWQAVRAGVDGDGGWPGIVAAYAALAADGR